MASCRFTASLQCSFYIAVAKLKRTGCRTTAGGSRPSVYTSVYEVYTHRQFFDGMMCKANASFSPADCVRFMSALLEFDDYPDILYRLTNPREYGLQCLRVALNQADSPEFLAQSLVPFLAKLGHDSLNSGTWRKPLLEVLDAISTFPGLLPRLGTAITSGNLPDAIPVAWFALTLAVNSETARANPELEALVQPLLSHGGAANGGGDPLLARGGGAALAARLLKHVLSPAGLGLGSSGQVLALDDLRMQDGGRHDNDAPNFKDMKIVFTSDEEADAARKRSVSDQEAVRLRGKAAALRHQLRALEDDLRRRKDLMAAEKEVKKLELALELQKALAPAQLAAWAAEQEHQAVVDQAAQEERAAAERLRLEADKLAAEEATKQAKLIKRRADQEHQLTESIAQMLQAEADKQRELQLIENDKRRVAAESASKREVVEGKAQAQLLSATTVELEKSQKRDLNSRQYNTCLYGNPGTGKTTVARICAALLTELGVLPDAQQMEHAPAPAAPAPPAPVLAPPSFAQAAPVVVDQSAPPAPPEQAEQQEDAAELAAVASAFDRLGPEFLADLQGALEQQGHDLSNKALVQQLAGDGSLPDALLPLLARSAGSARDLGMVREMVQQWKRAVQQQMELLRKLAKKGKRPVWRCAVCMRYDGPVKPYIQRYEEFDLP